MHSVEELVKKYESYSDEELLELHSNSDIYSEEARQAFRIVLTKKGGLDYLLSAKNRKEIMSAEIQRITLEVGKLNAPGVDVSFIKSLMTSDILSPEQLNDVIEGAYHTSTLEREDVEVKPKTIMGSVIGGIVACVAGGILWGLQLIYSEKIFVILVMGTYLFCYGIVRLFTGQSWKNQAVLIASILAFITAIFIGKIIFQVVGYQG